MCSPQGEGGRCEVATRESCQCVCCVPGRRTSLHTNPLCSKVQKLLPPAHAARACCRDPATLPQIEPQVVGEQDRTLGLICKERCARPEKVA
jgi:hypothetical protein